MDFNFIEKGGSWLTIDCIDQKLQGREKLYSLLEEDSKIYDALNKIVMEKIAKNREDRSKTIERKASVEEAEEAEEAEEDDDENADEEKPEQSDEDQKETLEDEEESAVVEEEIQTEDVGEIDVSEV